MIPGRPPASADQAALEDGNGGWTRNISLRWRLTFLTAAIVALVVSLMTIAAFFTVQNTMYREANANMQRQANQLLQSRYASEFALDAAWTAENLKILNPNLDAMYFAPGVFAGRGDTIELSATEISVLRGNKESSFRTDEAKQKRIYAVHDSSGATLVLAQDLGPTRELLRSLGVVLLLIGALGVFAAIGVGTTVSTAGLRPIGRLRRAVDYVTETDDLKPVAVHGDDELARLAVSFNDMISSLQASRKKQAELVADAGHELKTPLTSLRTNIELLMMASRSGGLAEEDRRDLERDVVGQIDELTTLVGDLVDLAREDGPQQVIEDVDLAEVLENSLERVKRRRPDLNFSMQTESWHVFGDPHALGRALLNLLDNAAKWSPDNGTVRVKMKPKANGLMEISFADSGPGIPVEDRAKVFERFYRSIQSRSMPGSGLGLAIVQQVVVRHGGTITIGESDDGGCLMVVCLPGVPDQSEAELNSTEIK